MKFITIATSNFLPYTRRLLASLRKSCANVEFVVYCDDAECFAPLSRDGANVQLLREIERLGVKRAKFTAYARALSDFGDFVYLDSDIIALEDLSGLSTPGQFSACPDDLSACSFIEDKRHPWPGDRALRNEVYVNSGVLHVPRSLGDFFERMRKDCLDDMRWDRYVLPGKLYDNHFLCAYLNLERVPVVFQDERRYNWQGFLQNGALQVVREGDTLVNHATGTTLALAHFAGVPDIDEMLCALPIDVASLLCERGSEALDEPSRSFAEFQATLSKEFAKPLPDEFAMKVFSVLRHELLHVADGGWNRDATRQSSYLSDAKSMVSLTYSRPYDDSRWSGLRCGGAYLTGDEYNYVERLLSHANIRTVLETGAGETSMLFRQNGMNALALEANEGPWLDRARAAGCRAIHIPFIQGKGFDDERLAQVLAGAPKEYDLVFIDSPGGTNAREVALEQILKKVSTKLLLFHDACRDVDFLFRCQVERRLRLVDYFPSPRGMALLAFGDLLLSPVPQEPLDVSLDDATCGISIVSCPARSTAGGNFSVTVNVHNSGRNVFSSQSAHPTHLSYHWFDERGDSVVWDGSRTALPFSIHSGHEATIRMDILTPITVGTYRLQVAMVQENVAWLGLDDEDKASHSVLIE